MISMASDNQWVPREHPTAFNRGYFVDAMAVRERPAISPHCQEGHAKTVTETFRPD